MLARVLLLLPYEVHLDATATYGRWEARTSDGLRAIIHPLARTSGTWDAAAVTNGASIADFLSWIRPAQSTVTLRGVTVDDKPVIPANLLVIDFESAAFDRSTDLEGLDPPVGTIFEVANQVLARLRFAIRSPDIRPLAPQRTPLVLYYIAGDRAELPPEEGLVRSRYNAAFALRMRYVDPQAWRTAAELTGFDGAPWDDLLLDAFAQLPDIEPSVVLASAALEAFVDYALETLAGVDGGDRALYHWIAGREPPHLKPSEAEQLDALLKALSGHSLKDDPGLWERFQHLRTLRNNIIHRGLPWMKGDVPATEEDAVRLVRGVQEIIAWTEQLLPEAKRRALPSPRVHHTDLRQLISNPGTPEVE